MINPRMKKRKKTNKGSAKEFSYVFEDQNYYYYFIEKNLIFDETTL